MITCYIISICACATSVNRVYAKKLWITQKPLIHRGYAYESSLRREPWNARHVIVKPNRASSTCKCLIACGRWGKSKPPVFKSVGSVVSVVWTYSWNTVDTPHIVPTSKSWWCSHAPIHCRTHGAAWNESQILLSCRPSMEVWSWWPCYAGRTRVQHIRNHTALRAGVRRAHPEAGRAMSPVIL